MISDLQTDIHQNASTPTEASTSGLAGSSNVSILLRFFVMKLSSMAAVKGIIVVDYCLIHTAL